MYSRHFPRFWRKSRSWFFSNQCPDIRLNYSIQTWSFEGHGIFSSSRRRLSNDPPFFLSFRFKTSRFSLFFSSSFDSFEKKLRWWNFSFFFSFSRIISTMGMDPRFIYPSLKNWKFTIQFFFFLSFFFRSLFYLELKSHEISISRILSVQWLGLLSFSNIYPWNTWSVRCLYWNETGGRSMRLRMGWKYTVHGV